MTLHAYAHAPHADFGMGAGTHTVIATAETVEELRAACERIAHEYFPDDGRDHERAMPRAERRRLFLSRLTMDRRWNGEPLFPPR